MLNQSASWGRNRYLYPRNSLLVAVMGKNDLNIACAERMNFEWIEK
jgi:hypothetical protein